MANLGCFELATKKLGYDVTPTANEDGAQATRYLFEAARKITSKSIVPYCTGRFNPLFRTLIQR